MGIDIHKITEKPMYLKRLSSPRLTLALLIVLAYALAVGLYWVARYGGWATDIDTIRMSFSAGGAQAEGRLESREGAYHAGYGYPVLLTFLSGLSGLSIQQLQISGGLWLPVIGLAAFICYRELLGQPGPGLLATLLLLLQPDFVFYVLRGSHEKITWLFALLMLFFLARSYRSGLDSLSISASIALFYLAFWGMAATNAYFASTFMTTFAFCFLAGIGLARRRPASVPRPVGPAFERLLITSFICFMLVFVFVTYAYQPAGAYYQNLSDLVDRVSALFLGAQPTSRAYTYVGKAWRGPGTYFFLTGVQWLIGLCSLGAWALQGREILGRCETGPLQRRLLWLMYTSLGIQLVFGIIADIAGFLSANLQVRLFVPFALLASPLAATLLWRGMQSLSAAQRRWLAPLAGALVAYAAIAALLKITNDPLVSNQWLFSAPSELRAGEWTDRHLQNQTVWIGTSAHEDTASRQFDMLRFSRGYTWQPSNSYVFGPVKTLPQNLLISQIMRLQANRSGLSLPATIDHNQLYDNGTVQFYQRRPQTPYQR